MALLAAADPVVVGVTVVATLVVAGLIVALVAVVRAASGLRRDAAVLAGEIDRALGDLDGAVARAEDQLARVDDLVGSAESLSDAIGSASRLASTAMSTPVIKVMAMGTGAARAGRRLKDGPEPAPPRRRTRAVLPGAARRRKRG